MLSGDGLVGGNPTVNTSRPRRGEGMASSSFIIFVVVVVVVVSHIQRIGCQPEKTTLHGGQSRSWSAEQVLFPVPVPAFCFGLATWVQPSHPASLLPSSASGANLVLTHRLFSSLPLSAAVRQFTCIGILI